MDKITTKTNKNNYNAEEELEHKLDRQIQKMKRCYRHTGPDLRNKLFRLFNFPTQYLKDILIRKSYFNAFLPKKIKTKTFFSKNFYIGKGDKSPIFAYGILYEHEIKLTKYFLKNIKNKKCLYDIGANFGYYSILARKLSKTIKIHAFEPEPDTFNILKRNSNNKDIKTNQLAVSNKNKNAVFYKNKNSSSVGSLIDPNKKGFRTIEVETITLDSYINKYNKADIIKIDIEGAEKLAIEGCANYLRNSSPEVIIEVWSKENDNYEKSHQAIKALQDLNYKPYKINTNGTIEKIINLKEFLENQTIIENLLFKNKKQSPSE